jgi:hypothetical protein
MSTLTEQPLDKLITSGGSVLQDILTEAAESGGYDLQDLTVLDQHMDPYRCDTQKKRRAAAWFAEQMERFVPEDRLGLRPLHYRIVSPGSIFYPEGNRGSTPYINSGPCWDYLQDAATYARWLGYIPCSRIIDERNTPPEFFYPENDVSLRAYLHPGNEVWVPWIQDLMPTFKYEGLAKLQQPFRIILYGEKSSLADQLRPTCQMLQENGVPCELLLPTGESSISLTASMCARAAASNRPTVVLYFNDFDPHGRQMAVSVARKIQALRHLETKILMYGFIPLR